MYNSETDWEESSCYSEEREWELPGGGDSHKFDTMKIPMVIGEFTVQIDVESKIKLPEPALEVKRIKKNVFLTQCRVIAGTKKVFLKGFIRKNIEYATIDCVTAKAISGDIKHTTVHVPFQCSTEVKCMIPEEVEADSPSQEINYFNEENLGVDMKERDLISEEKFNEKIYCELENSKIYEANLIEDAKKIELHPIEHEFQTFIEKEVVYLTLKLLRNQQIGEVCTAPEDNCSY